MPWILLVWISILLPKMLGQLILLIDVQILIAKEDDTSL